MLGQMFISLLDCDTWEVADSVYLDVVRQESGIIITSRDSMCSEQLCREEPPKLFFHGKDGVNSSRHAISKNSADARASCSKP